MTAERRSGERYASVLMIGRVNLAGQDQLCLVHNISARGLMARFATPPSVGCALLVECRGLPPTEAVVRWCRGELAGVEFRVARDAATRGERHDGAHAPRLPRFRTALPAVLLRGDATWPSRLRDISTGGACLEVDAPVRCGEPVWLSVGTCLRAVPARAVWQADALFGFRFLHPLSLPTLQCLVKMAPEWSN